MRPPLASLVDLIPSFDGEIYSFMGMTYFAPSSGKKIPEPRHGLIRVGLKVYDVRGWVESSTSYLVRWFDCSVPSGVPMEWSDEAA